MHLYIQTRLQTADQILLPLCQTQSDADRAVRQPSAVENLLLIGKSLPLLLPAALPD